MPIEHRIDESTGILRVRRWGHISTHDERKACDERAADPKIVPGILVLVDCTAVEPPDSVEIVKYVANCATSVAAQLGCGMLAIIVAPDVEYGMAIPSVQHYHLRRDCLFLIRKVYFTATKGTDVRPLAMRPRVR